MCGQLIYTSCRRGRGTSGSGIQVFSYSDDLDEKTRNQMCTMGSYSIAVTGLPSTIHEGCKKDYPTAFHYSLNESGQPILVQSSYLGVDWSGTRFGGNYIAHAFAPKSLKAYPIEYFQTRSFRTEIDKESVSSEIEPAPLPDMEPELDKERPINIQSVRAFADKDRLPLVKELVSCLLSDNKSVTLAAKHSVIPFYIAAATMMFPQEWTRSIPFQTFDSSGNTKDKPGIIGVWHTGDDVRISSKEKIEIPEAMAHYIDAAYTDPGLRDDFFSFVERLHCNIGLDRNSFVVFDLYYFCRNPQPQIPESNFDAVRTFVQGNAASIDDSVLSEYMDGVLALRGNDADAVSRDLRHVLETVSDPSIRERMSQRIEQLFLSDLRAKSRFDPNDPSFPNYLHTIKGMIEDGRTSELDIPMELCFVLKLWEDSRDEMYREAALSMQDNIDCSEILQSLKSEHTRYNLFLTPEYPLNDAFKSDLRSHLLADTDDFDITTLSTIIQSSARSDPDLALEICKNSREKSCFRDLMRAYLSAFEFSEDSRYIKEGLELLTEKSQIDKGCRKDIIDYLTSHRISLENETVRETIKMFNEALDPFSDDRGDMDLAKNIERYYHGYSKAIVEICRNNNIAALSRRLDFLNGHYQSGEDWTYLPTYSQCPKYLEKIVSESDSSNRTAEWYRAFINIFPSDRKHACTILSKILSDKLKQEHDDEAVPIIASMLQPPLTAEDQKKYLDPVGQLKPRRIKGIRKSISKRYNPSVLNNFDALFGSDDKDDVKEEPTKQQEDSNNQEESSKDASKETTPKKEDLGRNRGFLSNTEKKPDLGRNRGFLSKLKNRKD